MIDMIDNIYRIDKIDNIEEIDRIEKRVTIQNMNMRDRIYLIEKIET